MFPPQGVDLNDRIEANLRQTFLVDAGIFNRSKKVHIFLDSRVKPRTVEETIKALSNTGLSYTVFVGSGITKSRELLERLERNEKHAAEKNLAIVNVVRSPAGLELGLVLHLQF